MSKSLLHHIVKLLLKHKEVTCLNLSLVTLASDLKSNSNVGDLKTADKFFGESILASKSTSHRVFVLG